MAVYAFIDDVQVKVDKGSVSIENRIEERSVASFTVIDEAASAAYVRGQYVKIVRPGIPPFFKMLFSGFIDTPGRARISPGFGLLHDITCMDNHYLADKRLVVKSYATQTLAFIVNDIFTDYLSAEGITIGAIQTGPTIDTAIFNYVRVSEAFDALKDLSAFTWFIDEFKQLFFIDRSTYTAPWNLDSVSYFPMKKSAYLSTGNPKYRNRQWVKGGTGQTSLQTQNYIGDGVVESFALAYPTAQAPTVTEDAAPMDVGIKGIDTGKDYYWSEGSETIYAEVAPGIGVAVQVQYYGQYPVIALVSNSGAIIARQAIEGGTGIVEDMDIEGQLDSGDAMTESAKAKLDTWCQDAEKFKYTTWIHGLRPGQIQEITYAPFGLAAHEMLIESVSMRSRSAYMPPPLGELILYDVACVTGPVMGSWAKFFANLLARQDRAIRIGDSLLLVLLQEMEQLTLVETTARSEHATANYLWDSFNWDFATFA